MTVSLMGVKYVDMAMAVGEEGGVVGGREDDGK